MESTKDTAKRFKVSERRVQKYCEEGRIRGAKMVGNIWLIPRSASKPQDARFSAEIKDLISLSDLCKELSISIATGRNWVKLGKIKPTKEIKKTLYFSYEYLEKIKSEIKSGEISALKSRRNKKFLSGNDIYKSYVSDSSQNLDTVQKIIDLIASENIKISEKLINALLYDCAQKLFESKYSIFDTKFSFLIKDLISEKELVTAKNMYSKLFDFNYIYEKNEDILGLLYISLKNVASRKATGSYYTPNKIVKKLCKEIFSKNISNKTILDPCCGTGNFILQLPESIDYKNVYGNDLDKISVKLARINFALKYEIFDREVIFEHITEKNFLTEDFKTFDYIIGNPPWGYDFSEKEKTFLRKTYLSAVGSNIESYDVFIEKSLRILDNNGTLSFVLPESILNVKTHLPIRKIIAEHNSIQYLEFLGNAFDKVQCPSIIMQVLHNNRPFRTNGLKIVNDKESFIIKSERKINPEYFAFTIKDDEYSIIDKLENIKNKTTLKNSSDFALGIVTGNNKDYISNKKTSKNELVLKGSDLYKYNFKPAENYIKFEPKTFQQVAPVEFYRAEEKLLYRFICNQLVFVYDNNKTLSLNSANILIPKIEGLSIKYILAILNSRIAQFYFKKQFNSIKILRSHIEEIPIPYIDKKAQKVFISIVDLILKSKNQKEILKLYNELDLKIASIYGLNNSEYQIILDSMQEENLFLY